MLNDVTTKITDGLRDASNLSGEGVHVKIGVSSAAGPVTVTKGMDATRIKSLLGLSPLADAAIVSVESGASKIYCYPVPAAVQGKVGEVAKTGAGGGTCSVSGDPTNAFDVTVEITGKGGLNAALLRYSIDGGASYSKELTMPLGGKLELEDTGLTLTFAEATEGDNHFAIGDRFAFATTAPTMDNAGALGAMTQLQTFRQEFEYIHLVGGADRALWAAMSAAQQQLAATYHKACFVLLEAYAPAADESLAEYVARLQADRAGINNYDLQVCASRCLYRRKDGVTVEINAASIAAGQYSAVQPQVSIGQTRTCGVPETRFVASRPAGIDAYLEELDTAGYLTYRQYDGLAGWYVTNANMLAPEGSNYRYTEDVRLKNKLVRVLRKEALLQLQTDVDPGDLQAELDKKAQFIQAPADDMVRAGQIGSVQVTVPEGQTLAGGHLDLVVRYRQRGVLRSITIDLGVLGAAE